MNKSDFLTALNNIENSLGNSVEECKMTINGVRANLTKKKLGRAPNVSYEVLQETIDAVAPNINPKHWTRYAFAKAVNHTLIKKGLDSCQDYPQISNLIKVGKLVIPPAPVEV